MTIAFANPKKLLGGAKWAVKIRLIYCRRSYWSKYKNMLMVKPYISPKRVKTESIGEIIPIQSSF